MLCSLDNITFTDIKNEPANTQVCSRERLAMWLVGSEVKQEGRTGEFRGALPSGIKLPPSLLMSLKYSVTGVSG